MDSKQTDQRSVDLDLSTSARKPVHIIGHIQSHGVLVALSESDLCVRYVSANVSELFGEPASVIGASLASLIGTEQFARFRNERFIDHRFANSLQMVVGTTKRRVNCMVHREGQILIAEFEFLPEVVVQPINVQTQIRMFRRMEELTDISAIATLAVNDIQELTGFERVMMYQFDSAWNTEVIAEVTTPTFGSCLGLHFPASDIPIQTRQLLTINALRSVVDVDSVAVPIVQTGAQTSLDLTHSYLRSASPIYLQYLRKLNVTASMTVSIIVKGQLWGFIACHHSQPRGVDFPVRTLCELIAGFCASQIGSRIDTRELHSHLRFRKCLADYLNVVDASKALADDDVLHNTRLLDLLDADGIISCIDSAVLSNGSTVPQQTIEPIIRALAAIAVAGVASSNMLCALDPSATAYSSDVSGALYMDLTEGTGDYLLLLRRELVETVKWARNPDKAMSADDAEILRPRTSFSSWQQTVHGKCRAWSAREIENARILREQLTVLRAAQKAHDTEDRIRYLATHDALTGLSNRLAVQHIIEQNIVTAADHHASFAVLFIDLDNFKTFNDTLGHAAGDEILRIAAARITRQVRNEDSVGRLGGDEFVVVIPGSHDAYAFKAAARIVRAIQEPLDLEYDTTLKITASIGLSRYPTDGTTTDELLARSDIAMYRVKVRGGNALQNYGASGICVGSLEEDGPAA